ncbi:uncharacterized protein BDZ99DRAFT_514194 [Mytilinidion resinicola]|uniref:Uncharacterized protein n=1 Tax=Mytilinidion resinicola TaxID=574789 RepID=A0A6A6ZB94_9PEZI|nr:uncharacterized protein BDZ99DRAFT_514194 [Mytilinidion resinicola]KAF2817973.1 hypothetical protein BDZ99DRAFT_514194 [Mytilinidion resinicola]
MDGPFIPADAPRVPAILDRLILHLLIASALSRWLWPAGVLQTHVALLIVCVACGLEWLVLRERMANWARIPRAVGVKPDDQAKKEEALLQPPA